MSEQARYQVRTPMALWLVNGAVTALCVIVFGAMLLLQSSVPSPLVLLALALCSVCVAFWFGMSAYRVGGGRNLIRFYPDRIEVPAVRERKPIVFVREGLELEVRDVVVRYRLAMTTLADIKRGKLIELRGGGHKRKLSTLTLDDRHDEAALIADLQRFVTGQPAIGRAAHDAPPPRTEYDDRIDRELAQLE
ncbi:MAG TPA: hypothetical protein VIV40_32080 [Kofleriaceae bacterium]